MPPKRAKQIRDPEATRKRILAAAKLEFAKNGLGGARVDRIATRAKSNKRMLYHYFGNKDDLFRKTLEDSYAAFRLAEIGLKIENDEPIVALKRLVSFTWDYYLANPEFITLVNSENLHKAKHLKKSTNMDDLNRTFVGRMESLLKRGADAGLFRDDIDAVQILITLSGLGYHYLTNQYTGAIVYGRALMTAEAKAARLEFNTQALLRLVCSPATLLKLQETE